MPHMRVRAVDDGKKFAEENLRKTAVNAQRPAEVRVHFAKRSARLEARRMASTDKSNFPLSKLCSSALRMIPLCCE
jgi:hypothetical protein